MNGSNPDVPPPFGRKIEAPVPTPPAPVWRPLRPGYETDGMSVRTTPMPTEPNSWAEWMRRHCGGYMP